MFFTRWHRPTALSFPCFLAGVDGSRLTNILTVEKQCHAVLLARLIWCGFVALCSTEDIVVPVVCWLESPSLTCCPVVWGSSVSGLLMAVPATHNCSMYYTEMSSHPCKGKDMPFEAFCTVPQGPKK